MKVVTNLFKTKPIFLFALPVFFVLHGATENYDFVPLPDALFLALTYMAASIIISILFWLLYRNWTKANLVSFFLMAFHFFFGIVHDTLKDHFNGVFISRYSFILPASFIFFLILIIWLKKRKKPLVRMVNYLNILLLILLLVDSAWLTKKILRPGNETYSSEKFSACDSCENPDIYLVILDEYAGNTELMDLFQFDNSVFENELRKKGFHIINNSRGNYNYTPFSMASILSMNYLDLDNVGMGQRNLTYCYQTIRNSGAMNFLLANGYEFYNYSVFDFKGQPARRNETFLPNKTKLITPQTFLSRIDNDIRFNTVTGKFRFRAALKQFTYNDLRNNKEIYKLTWNISSHKTSKPKFIYAHLMMPHYPYYFDRKGNPLPLEKLVEGNQVHSKDYIEYLQYTNPKIMELVDHILKTSEKPPIIVLMGDHGFRHFTTAIDHKYYFLNLNSVYFPNGDYHLFYDSMTIVNQFRIIFNNQFKQNFPLLKDSTIFLPD